jgi:hypothetical protein
MKKVPLAFDALVSTLQKRNKCDTVLGKQHTGAIVSLVERKS